MTKMKGCASEACVAYKKRRVYKNSDDYCSKCGSRLVYVCKKCHTLLPNKLENYCERCLAQRQDKKDRNLKNAGAITAGAAAVGVAAFKIGKMVVKGIAKLK